jgi:hypothetical protein
VDCDAPFLCVKLRPRNRQVYSTPGRTGPPSRQSCGAEADGPDCMTWCKTLLAQPRSPRCLLLCANVRSPAPPLPSTNHRSIALVQPHAFPAGHIGTLALNPRAMHVDGSMLTACFVATAPRRNARGGTPRQTPSDCMARLSFGPHLAMSA